MLATHQVLKTWSRMVDAFIALTEFARNKFVEGGLPPDKVFVRYNFLNNAPRKKRDIGKFALFVGRLSPEKGLDTLLEGWGKLPDVPLKIVGSGPLDKWIWESIKRFGLEQVEMYGFLSKEEVLDCMSRASFVIVPSRWYECFPRVILEAYALGVPVIASDLGSMTELVRDKETGLLFRVGDPEDLAHKIRFAIEHPADLAKWGERAHQTFEEHFTARSAYERLIDIYRCVSR